MTSLNTVCQNMKLKLAKMIKNFVKILELQGDRLEVCVSVYQTSVSLFACQRLNSPECNYRDYRLICLLMQQPPVSGLLWV